ncbi:MAG: nitroreductase family protein [Pseudomonadota bacterium]
MADGTEMAQASVREKTVEALARRYGSLAPDPEIPWNAHIDLLLSHRSVRAYLDAPLPSGTLTTLVAAAQSAATSSNLQTWSVVAVTQSALKSALAELAGGQKQIEQCPLFLVWLADLSRNARLGTAHGVDMHAMPYLETFLVAAIDAALAAQNAVVAAEALDLSTVYIGAMRNKPEAVAALLGLPDQCVAVFGLCVGYADTATPTAVKPRLPQEVVLHHERYGARGEAELCAAHDAEMVAFSESQGMGPQSWSARVLGRLGPVSAMSGRDKLSEILRRMGFGLR